MNIGRWIDCTHNILRTSMGSTVNPLGRYMICMCIYQGCRSKLRRLGSALKLSMKSHCRVQAFVGMLAPLSEHQIYIRCVAQLIMTGSHDSPTLKMKCTGMIKAEFGIMRTFSVPMELPSHAQHYLFTAKRFRCAPTFVWRAVGHHPTTLAI